MSAPPVPVRRYNPASPRLFAAEKRRLKKHLDARISHVGSTAVPGLPGKGFIDLLVVVPRRRLASAKIALGRAGYDRPKNGGDRERTFFRRVSAHTYHAHLTWAGSATEAGHLLFRGMLRADARLRRDYAREKRRLLGVCRTRRMFRHRKGLFIRRAVVTRSR